jgi:hypothetical protein
MVGPLLPHCRQEPRRYGNIPLPMLVISLSQKNNLNRYVFGVMECWSAGVYKIPSSKHQITNKSQIPILNDQNRFEILKLGTRPQGGESKRSADNFGHCGLFVICDL